MTPDDVRAAAEQLVEFHERFAPLFGKEQAQDHAYDYLKGLMVCPERKSIEPIALNVGHGDVSALQKFINIAPWDHDDVQAEVQAVFADELVPSAAGSPIGVVGVVDESGFAKKGEHTAGVARQHNGRLGKEDNCQVGVFLVGVTPGGSALLDHQLYLPEAWCEDDPGGGTAATRSTSPRRSPSGPSRRSPPGWSGRRWPWASSRLDWIIADEEYGRNGEFLDELETAGAAVRGRGAGHDDGLDRGPGRRASRRTAAGAGCRRGRAGRRSRTVAAVGAGLAAEAWRTLQVREGAKGPLVFEFAAVRVWAVRHAQPGPPVWLLIRRSLEADARGQVLRHQRRRRDAAGGAGAGGLHAARVEEYFEDGKSYLGMAQYETRSWVGWHHHMSLVALAHLFVTLTRRDLEKKRRS